MRQLVGRQFVHQYMTHLELLFFFSFIWMADCAQYYCFEKHKKKITRPSNFGARRLQYRPYTFRLENMRTTYNILTAVNVRFEEHIVSKDNMRVDIESQMKTIVFIILQNIFAARGIF